MLELMRLSPQQVETIVSGILSVVENESILGIHLFGSRTDPQAKGGDIDLWIETNGAPQDARLFARRVRLALEQSLGQQKIDVVVASLKDPADDGQAAFLRLISESKVTLWPKSTN